MQYHCNASPQANQALDASVEKAALQVASVLAQNGELDTARLPDAVWFYHNADNIAVGAILRWNTKKQKDNTSATPQQQWPMGTGRDAGAKAALSVA